MKLNKQRKLRSAVELICEILKITDKKLNDFIESGKIPELPKDPKAPKVEEPKAKK